MRRSKGTRSLVAIFAAFALILAACGDDGDTGAADGHTFSDGEVVTMILPTNPGGGFDAQALLFVPAFEAKLQEVTGTNVEVRIDYVPGGGHLVGHQELVRSDPDGRTLAYVDMNNTVLQRVIDGEDLDVREWTPIGGVVQDGFAFYARADLFDDLPSNDMQGLYEYSQQQSILVGSPSTVVTLTTLILQGIMAEQGLDVDMDIVTYEGTGPVTTAALRGEIDFGVSIPAGVRAFVDEEDTIEWLMQANCEASDAIPDVPTLHDMGAPGADDACQILGTVRAVFGPPGVPADDAAVLQEALDLAINDPDFIAEFENATGSPPVYQPADQLGNLANSLIEQWEAYSHLFD